MMDDLEERKKRLEKAIAFLISIGEIESDAPIKNIATRMHRDYGGVCSAVNGKEKYLTRKFAMAFCSDFGNIISFDWLWEGKGEMTASRRYEENVETAGRDTGVDSQKERLRMLKDWIVENDETCKHSESRVLKMMGLKEDYFNTAQKRNWGSLHSSLYVRIKKTWPFVNLDWLMAGKGEMLAERFVRSITSESGVPYFDVDFLGGFDEMENDYTRVPAYYIDLQPFNDKGNMWLNITGDSMAPRINSGDKICIRKIQPQDVIYGEIYAIVTRGGMRTVKWLTRSTQDDMVRLVPENKDPRFGDYQDIAWNDIIYIYKVIGAVRSF